MLVEGTCKSILEKIVACASVLAFLVFFYSYSKCLEFVHWWRHILYYEKSQITLVNLYTRIENVPLQPVIN